LKPTVGVLSGALAVAVITAELGIVPSILAQSVDLHNAPAADAQTKNPYQGSPQAAVVGKKLYGQNCAQCHGANLQGIGPAPALDSPEVKTAKPGELFWFISAGKVTAGMPSWSNLPKTQRWQIVTFLQSPSTKSAAK
jgi:mono/diheme cytochrome c family protein